jgi:hypothetical protein
VAKPKPAEPVRVEISLTADTLSILIAGSGDIMAAKNGDHWRLDPLECEALGQSYKAALDAYYPDLSSSKGGILLIALVQTWAVIQPRLKIDAQKPKRPPVHWHRGNGKDESPADNAEAEH